MTKAADLVVVGSCEKVEPVWLDKKVYTVATIRVSQSAKGHVASGETIEVYILGGRVKKPIPVKMHVPGAATISVGEEAVLFLEAQGKERKYHRLVGLSQGKIPVTVDSETGEKSAHYRLPIKGVQLVDKEGKPFAPDESAEPPEPGSLEGFLGGVRQMVLRQQEEGGSK